MIYSLILFLVQIYQTPDFKKGLAEGSGTRSSLLWECRKAIEAKLPKYLLMENVKNLVSKKFTPYLKQWLRFLEGQGYNNYTKVLNAKDYGVPQNRERVFMVSIMGEVPFHFPKPLILKTRLRDILEKSVDKSFYVSDKLLRYIYSQGRKEGYWIGGVGVQDGSKVALSVTSNYYKSPRQANYIKESVPELLIREATKKGYIEIPPGGVFDASYPESLTRRGRVQDNGKVSPTLTACGDPPCLYEGIEPKCISYTRDGKGKVISRHLSNIANTVHGSTGCGGSTDCFVAEPQVLTTKRTEYGKALRKDYDAGIIQESRHNMTKLEPRTDGISNTITTVQKDNLLMESFANYRIRKLTPRECFRLMGVLDDDINKIQAAGISQTQQYKMAGNSIVVDVLYHIFRKMFLEKDDENKQLSLF